jgi:hypothetical protein
MNPSVESNNNKDDELSIYNFKSIIHFIQNNIVQIILFILVFVIIYLVDRVTHFNTMLVAIQQQQIMKDQMKKSKNAKNLKMQKITNQNNKPK